MRIKLQGYKLIIVLFILISCIFITLPLMAQQVDPEKPSNAEPAVSAKQKEKLVPSNLYQGEVQINTTADDKFTGEQKTIKEGAKIDLTVSTVLDSNLSMEGDQFFAEVTDDVVVDGGVIIPMGSVVHGTVTETETERRLGRDGFVKIDFDSLITPDGREIPIKAQLSTKSHPLKSFAKVLLTDTGYTLVGGAMGGLFALKVGGIGMAVASHGYSVAGGAAVGATIGAAASLIRKGKPTIISPGDQIKLKLNSNLNLPVIKSTTLMDEETFYEGLTVNIYDCKVEKDPFGEANTITMGVDVVNKTKRTFTFMDVALVNDSGRIFYPSPFGDTSIWFNKITPQSRLQGYLSFCVDNPRQKHWIVFYDKYSRTQLAKISIRNAMKKIEEAKKKGNKKKPS